MFFLFVLVVALSVSLPTNVFERTLLSALRFLRGVFMSSFRNPYEGFENVHGSHLIVSYVIFAVRGDLGCLALPIDRDSN